MEAEQQTAEKPTNHRRKQKRNQNMHRNDENENRTTQNPLDSVKAVLSESFIAKQL